MPDEAIPVRIQRRRTAGWRMPEGAVYVGRPTPWANQVIIDGPFPGGLWGLRLHAEDDEPRFFPSRREAHELAVALYRQKMRADLALIGQAEYFLRGRDLVCWCSLDLPCHADVLLEIANAPIRCETRGSMEDYRLPPITLAETVATRLHAGQTDKAGQPYIEHLRRVAAILVRRWPDATVAESQAAWLHDALEDTPATAGDLLHAGIQPEAVEIVRLLTKPAGAVYLDWIRLLAASGNRGAIRVKLADNEDNQDPARVAALPGAAEMVRARYAPARAILMEALGGGEAVAPAEDRDG